MRRRPWYIDMIRCRGMWATWTWILACNIFMSSRDLRWTIPLGLITLWLDYEILRTTRWGRNWP